METIRFILAATPSDPFVVVSGGADADHDNTIEDNGETGTFTRFGNTWTRQQDVLSPLSGTLWGVVLALGAGTAWTLEIRGPNNTLLQRQQGVLGRPVETVVGRLS